MQRKEGRPVPKNAVNPTKNNPKKSDVKKGVKQPNPKKSDLYK